MKKAVIFLLLAALLLAGCAKQTQFVVDAENQTVSDGSYTYEYTDTTNGDVRTIVIHYPGGGSYTYRREGNTGAGNYTNTPGMSQYTQGHLLVSAILNPETQTEEQPTVLWPLIVAGTLVAAWGLWQVCFPYKVWDIFFRRRYQEDAGNYALTRIIASAICEIVLGIGVILIAIFVSLK